jgi:hypothetical protein
MDVTLTLRYHSVWHCTFRGSYVASGDLGYVLIHLIDHIEQRKERNRL